MSDDLGDRMKLYEALESERILCPRLPVMVRLDGRAFHSWTRGLERPFDAGFLQLMRRTTTALVQETNARIGYTQSDEISLVLHESGARSESYFAGRVQKIVSILAAHATAVFNASVPELVPAREGSLALFDCRAWVVPSEEEAANALLWRERDATRNSLHMLARAHFSHEQCHEKSTAELHEMLHTVGVNWADLAPSLKRGSWFRRCRVLKELTPELLSQIPEKHRPSGPVERYEVRELDMPPFGRVTNRVPVIFEGALPLVVDGAE